jgi:hypothetical protein
VTNNLNGILRRAAIYIKPSKRLHDFRFILLSRVYSKPLFHVIGDSHVFALANVDFFIIHHVGPATAYNLYSQSSTTKSNKKLFSFLKKINKEKDFVILVFGEIDSRIQIYNQYMKHGGTVSIEQLIDNTIKNYGQVLQSINKKGFAFLVYGIPPASRVGNIYQYPYYADEKNRVLINHRFNKKLSEFCIQQDILYLDIQSNFSESSGLISEVFSEDLIHLNRKAGAIIANEIRTKLLRKYPK